MLRVFLALFLANPVIAKGEKEGKPNVLLLMGDDHATFAFGAYGSEKAKTPHLDTLAASGTRFDHAYVNCPMCTPSRQSLLTGRLPHSVGVTVLRTPLSEEAITLAEVLSEAGYETAAIGKMHFNSQLTHGFDLLLDHKEHRAALNRRGGPRPIPEGVEVLPQWKPFKDPARVWLNGMYAPFGYREDMAGTWFAEKSAEFLKQEREAPFFLVSSFYEPHSPFHFPIESSNLYDPSTFEVPEIGPEDDWQIPEIFRDLTDEEKQRIAAAYFTSAAFLDTNIGRVLQALRESSQERNTLVVYVGDHGYHLGHHGRFEKHSLYERAVKAPLVIRLPGQIEQPVTAQELVEFIDIFPTIAQVCGLEVPEGVQGRSLLPLLRGEEGQGRDWVFSEYYHYPEAMVRTDRYKYIYSSGTRERDDGYATGKPLPGRTRILYDMVEDPEEMHNLAGDEKYREVVDDLEAKMLERFASTYPAEKGAPPEGLDRADRLDWYLEVRD